MFHVKYKVGDKEGIIEVDEPNIIGKKDAEDLAGQFIIAIHGLPVIFEIISTKYVIPSKRK